MSDVRKEGPRKQYWPCHRFCTGYPLLCLLDKFPWTKFCRRSFQTVDHALPKPVCVLQCQDFQDFYWKCAPKSLKLHAMKCLRKQKSSWMFLLTWCLLFTSAQGYFSQCHSRLSNQLAPSLLATGLAKSYSQMQHFLFWPRAIFSEKLMLSLKYVSQNHIFRNTNRMHSSTLTFHWAATGSFGKSICLHVSGQRKDTHGAVIFSPRALRGTYLSLPLSLPPPPAWTSYAVGRGSILNFCVLTFFNA